ncbi:EGF-like domain protein [Ancylostoma caninum]|uniref:EGF-like domain protein n=1 Tax=Ancylostoma caninum TaxID=29170 RepID=A0A368H734_ANCCA|nr:EGF-like domain protein [Ancylostoma caninum]
MLQYFLIFLFVVYSFAVLRKNKSCVNGELEGDRCFCKDGWTGVLCHRRMNCDGFERHSNGSCIMCGEGWIGPDCDIIDCSGHGTPNYDLTSCKCEKPYSGKFCEKFLRKDVYSFYNNKVVSRIGALGALTCIPLVVIYATCDRYAKRRRQERVEKHLEGTVINHKKSVNREAVALLLSSIEE